jgi:hypothetical protein
MRFGCAHPAVKRRTSKSRCRTTVWWRSCGGRPRKTRRKHPKIICSPFGTARRRAIRPVGSVRRIALPMAGCRSRPKQAVQVSAPVLYVACLCTSGGRFITAHYANVRGDGPALLIRFDVFSYQSATYSILLFLSVDERFLLPVSH